MHTQANYITIWKHSWGVDEPGIGVVLTISLDLILKLVAAIAMNSELTQTVGLFI